MDSSLKEKSFKNNISGRILFVLYKFYYSKIIKKKTIIIDNNINNMRILVSDKKLTCTEFNDIDSKNTGDFKFSIKIGEDN